MSTLEQQQQPRYVQPGECKRMRDLNADGLTVFEIADSLDRCGSTVRRHVGESCQHCSDDALSVGRRESPTVDDVHDEINRLADDMGRVPSQTDHVTWDDRNWHTKTMTEAVGGGWKAALRAADMPDIALDSPKFFREKVYESPELVGGFDD